ncbi:lytic transglycosylase domain-containing protein [Sphingomonas sp. QA11]|uniref:lytic transglycosylase domain-containing protein n=1 Tax=Sphingomonas sp. QA11 TaxID=2950605 RepID=UPI0023494EC1|nr:lytic transglycosylase domain-containing protein [Sphingomonas sp. QA11]WCM26602.1 lytic transglycosylase domain-containing protein [Sphingomonas sp. QA11]
MTFNPIANLVGTKSTGSVQSAIALASQKTGIDFNYLMGQAQLESGMRADARAGTSSASGLYQFIEQSWLRVVKQHGTEHGLGWAADSISTTSSGRMAVSDPGLRRSILALRNDPQTASLMAAEHASDNKDAIESALGRDANGTDLYMAHFLGLGGARSFLGAMQDSPNRSGAAMFPAAARANHNIFYASNGQPRTLAQIYDRFTAKLENGAAGGAAKVGGVALASTTLGESGATVIPGNGETSTSDAAVWAQATLDQINGGAARVQTANLMRPTPDTARLAYMMLATLGA